MLCHFISSRIMVTGFVRFLDNIKFDYSIDYNLSSAKNN